MPIYQKQTTMTRRIIPLPVGGDFGVCIPATLATEGYYLEYDVSWPLLPEHPMQPDVISVYQFAANPGFTAGEWITGAAGLDVQELDFTGAIPVPGFVRGEVITDTGTATTATVGRRYSDGRYLVYDVTGLWGGAVTGDMGGGGTAAGTVLVSNPITARFDSVHWKEREKILFRQNTGIFPPGSHLVGSTSGVLATVLGVEPPYMVAELAKFISQLDTQDTPVNLMFKIVLLYGDLALLNYDLGAAADYGQRRAIRNELVWLADTPHAEADRAMVTVLDMQLMQLSGRWGAVTPVPSIATPAGIVDPFFRDGFVLRCYVSGGAGALGGNPVFTRQLTLNEYGEFQSVQFRNGI